MKKFNQINEAEAEEVKAPEKEAPKSGSEGKKPEDAKKSDEETLNKLTELMKKDYTSFVKELSAITSDNNLFPKLKSLILSGDKDGSVDDEKFGISEEYDQKVIGLVPTQNEIDRDKSLAFPITFPAEYVKIGVSEEDAKSQISDILKGTSVKINKMPIVVFDYQGKTYILDGHHRWSSVHALNQGGSIKAIKLTIANKEIDPLRALKAVQLSIATAINQVPSSKAGTDETNLLLASSNGATEKYLNEKMSDGFINIYKEVKDKTADKSKIVEFLMSNIKQLQKVGFVKGAPTREVMPQTDANDTLKKNQDLWKKPLETGKINLLPSYESRVIKTFEKFMTKWKKGEI